MKKLAVILVFAFSVFQLEANWEKVTAITPSSLMINEYWLDVQFLDSDPNYGWACGYGGRVVRTTNGGTSWTGVIINGTDQLESIHFVNQNVGYTSGQGVIFKSTDGGKVWRDITPLDQEIMLWGTYFLTEDFGFVIGGNCLGTQRFYRTSDGGNSWVSFTQNRPNTKLSDLIVMPGTGIGYASSSGLIWKSTDMGSTWNVFSQTGGMDWQEEITFYGKSFLVPFSEGCDGTTSGRGGMRFSVNNGTSWRNYQAPSPMYGTFLLDSLRGWACGLNEAVYYTSDGGLSWELKNCGIEPGGGLDDIWFINDTTGWLAGKGLYKYKRNSIPQPSISALGEVEVCQGDSVTLSLAGTFNSVRWSTGATTYSIKVGTSGKYSAFVKDSECEYAYSNEIEVVVRDAPEITLQSSHSKPPCEGDTVELSVVSPFSTIKWSNGKTDTQIEVTQSGRYLVTVEDDFGCIDSLAVDIVFNKLPEPIITALTKTNVCLGDSVLLQIVPNYPNVVWHSTTKRNLATGNYFLTGDEGEYFAEVYDANGCFGISDKIAVTVRVEKNRLALQLDADRKEFFIDSTRYPELACRYLVIKNISNEETILGNPSLYYNLSFSLPQSQLPLRFAPLEEKRLMICYSPRSLYFERDTLIIEDVCNDQHLPLVAYGEGNTYTGNTRCDAELMMQTIKINSGTTFVTTSPYPNPANKKSAITFAMFRNLDESAELQGELFDIFGNIKANAMLSILSNESVDGGILQTGELEFNTGELPRGIYLAKITLGAKAEIYRIVVE